MCCTLLQYNLYCIIDRHDVEGKGVLRRLRWGATYGSSHIDAVEGKRDDILATPNPRHQA
jgi:hypothetical protein